MKSIILNIRAKYDEMGHGEKKIADALLADPQGILSSSISDFATEVGCGDATVVRFARRLGLAGYGELKIAIAREISTLSDETATISKSDSCFDMFSKRISDIRIALENTKSVLDPDTLEQAAKTIMTAGRIVIFGLGNSAAVAHDAQHKFLRVGLNATACSDNHLQAILASHLDQNSVAIGVSHSGNSVDIVDALRLARLSGATTICITNHRISPVTEVSDLCLFTKSAETRHSLLAMSSRIAQLTIFDAIYTYIIAKNDPAAAQAIKATETALKEKKY